MVIANVALPVPVALVAVIVTFLEIGIIGVPLITPVEVVMFNQAGKLVAV
jgi:hypothetical protein